MANIRQLVESLGNLHDAKITSFVWLADRAEVRISIKDLHSNFRGLPEYEGPRPATFLFSGISQLDIAVVFTTRGLLVFDWSITEASEGYRTEISFSPGGKVQIVSSSIVQEAAASS